MLYMDLNENGEWRKVRKWKVEERNKKLQGFVE